MKPKQTYICSACGGHSPRWQGQCPACGEWNTLEARQVAAATARAATPPAAVVAPTSLDQAQAPPGQGRATGLPELDQILGSGLMPGAALLLAGEPGIGKSTLLLQLAGSVAALGMRALYVSGEESLPQLKSRADRLGLARRELMAMATTSSDDALAVLAADPPGLMVVDSVQTLASPRAEGLSGSVGQVRAVASELFEAAKKTETTLVLVGHVTKEGQIAGPKLLEHMVDTVLSLEGDRRRMFRVLRVLKNRFGPSDEAVVFNMLDTGLEIVADPATFFLDERDPSLSGAALVMAMDGQRPFAVEAQALAAKSYLNIPRRTSLGFDGGRLNMLLAVLEKRLKANLASHDIYAKIGGGLFLRDPGLDLGVAAAVLSSLYDRPLPAQAAFWGEVDLNGRIRPVSGHEARLKQAKRLGFGPLFHPPAGKQAGVGSLGEMARRLFNT